VRVRALESAVPAILSALTDELPDAAAGGWFEGLRVVNVAVVNPKPQTLNPRPQILNPKPETLNPKPETRNPKPETLNPKP